MKIAIIHDWLVNWGGAENVTSEINKIFPEADIFTTVNFLTKENRERFAAKNIYTTEIQGYPFAKKFYQLYLSKMPMAIEKLDLSEYDLIISASHAVAKGVITGPNQLHICYCYTPIRYAWDMKWEYIENSPLKIWPFKNYMEMVLFNLRNWDVRNSNQVDYFTAISHFTADRIKKYYNRNSDIIKPPVNVNGFEISTKERENFYLTASRLVEYKKIDIIIEAFNKMPEKKLVVIGAGGEFKKLKKIAGINIELLGYQPFEELKNYMQKARGFIFAAKEDFGLVPVEAQACGTPVIAFGEAGSLDTVITPQRDSKNYTGVFFDKQTPESIIDAIKKFEKMTFDPLNCRKNAEDFSVEKFDENFRNYVEKKYEDWRKTKI